MPSSQVQPLPQGPPSLVEGSRAEGSADEVLLIALAALTYGKLCGGEDEHGRSFGDVMQAVEGFSRGYVEGGAWHTPEEVTLPLARTHARTHARAHAGGGATPPGPPLRGALERWGAPVVPHDVCPRRSLLNARAHARTRAPPAELTLLRCPLAPPARAVRSRRPLAQASRTLGPRACARRPLAPALAGA